MTEQALQLTAGRSPAAHSESPVCFSRFDSIYSSCRLQLFEFLQCQLQKRSLWYGIPINPRSRKLLQHDLLKLPWCEHIHLNERHVAMHVQHNCPRLLHVHHPSCAQAADGERVKRVCYLKWKITAPSPPSLLASSLLVLPLCTRMPNIRTNRVVLSAIAKHSALAQRYWRGPASSIE